jgi:hypothetical protein
VNGCCHWNRGDDDAVKANIDIWVDLYAVMHERMALVHEDSNTMKIFSNVTTVIERKAGRLISRSCVYTVRHHCIFFVILYIKFNKNLDFFNLCSVCVFQLDAL